MSCALCMPPEPYPDSSISTIMNHQLDLIFLAKLIDQIELLQRRLGSQHLNAHFLCKVKQFARGGFIAGNTQHAKRININTRSMELIFDRLLLISRQIRSELGFDSG
jgi:hypothetical protein